MSSSEELIRQGRELVGDVEKPRVPPRTRLAITADELEGASLTPRCIVESHTYADLAQIVAPGGTGKTTLLLHELICIAIARPVWGLKVKTPGWSLIVTAEDQRERLVARMREIMDAMDLSPLERRRALADMAVWDVTGEQIKLVYAHDGNLQLTTLADEIVEAYRDDPPVVVLFDPLVSFGAAEERVNDNEQALVTAARRIIRGLGCCVRYVHHTGKANARDKALDQYGGRGGSALPDGSRMTFVLQTWEPEDRLKPPPGCKPERGSSITVLARPKLSYAPPNLPLIWIKRTGFRFEHHVELNVTTEQKAAARAEQMHQFLTFELSQDRRYTRRQLDDCTAKLGMTRAEMREALTELQVSGRVTDADLPKDQRQGSRKTYLCPSNRADLSGAVSDE